MTRSVLSLRSRGLLVAAVVALVLVGGFIAIPPEAQACGSGCQDRTVHPRFPMLCVGGGTVWCEWCDVCDK